MSKSLTQMCADVVAEKDKQIADLQSQLAEKEKEISNIKGLVRERDKQIKNLKTNKKRVVGHKNKAKIDFAVEQLEKVTNYMITDEKDMFGANYLMNSVYVLEFIDNQINALKGEK